MTAWLVDGMNVIGSRPDGWWRDRAGAQRRLAGELAPWAARIGEPVCVVFDGRPHEIEAPPVEVVFATRRGRDAADDVIVERVREAREAPALTVVTADRELERRVTELGARVVRPSALRDALGAG